MESVGEQSAGQPAQVACAMRGAREMLCAARGVARRFCAGEGAFPRQRFRAAAHFREGQFCRTAESASRGMQFRTAARNASRGGRRCAAAVCAGENAFPRQRFRAAAHFREGQFCRTAENASRGIQLLTAARSASRGRWRCAAVLRRRKRFSAKVFSCGGAFPRRTVLPHGGERFPRHTASHGGEERFARRMALRDGGLAQEKAHFRGSVFV